MKNKIITLIILLAVIGVGYYLYTKSQGNNISTVSTENGYSTYKDGQYYFTFKYPSDMYLVSDPDRTAWPNAILLMRIPGSQAYDLVVESWSSESEARSSKPDLIKQSRGSWITFRNEHNYLAGSPQDKAIEDIIKSVTF